APLATRRPRQPQRQALMAGLRSILAGQSGGGGAGEARRLQRRLRDASDLIRRDLDTEHVIRVAADAVQDALRPTATSIWLAHGNELPQLAYITSKNGDAPEPPHAVLDC